MIYIIPSTDPAYREMNVQPLLGWVNLLAEGTLADSELPASAPRAQAVTESTFDFWGVDSDPSELLVTFPSAVSAELALIAGHSLGSNGATLEVIYYDGASWVTLYTVSPTDNEPFLILWPSRSATGWGFRVSGALAEIGAAWIGPRFLVPGGVLPDYQPVWASKRINRYPGLSRRGQLMSQSIEQVGAKLLIPLLSLDYDFVHETMKEFRDHYNLGRAFIWASAPALFTTDVAYGWASEGATFQPRMLAHGEFMNLTLEMEAFVEP